MKYCTGFSQLGSWNTLSITMQIVDDWDWPNIPCSENIPWSRRAQVVIVGVLALMVDFQEVMMTSPPELAHCAPPPPHPVFWLWWCRENLPLAFNFGCLEMFKINHVICFENYFKNIFRSSTFYLFFFRFRKLCKQELRTVILY